MLREATRLETESVRDAMPAGSSPDLDRSASGPMICAATRDGHLLPVIDVTDPRFAVPDDPDALRRLFDASQEEERQRRRIPKLIMRMMLRSAAKRSLLLRALFAGDTTFLDGITTYVMKLGPANLPPPYDSAMDRRVAASPHMTLLRLRTQQVAALMADGLTAELERATTAPLHLINIAGGPAIDSVNTLIVLRRRNAHLLRRPIAIHVLDLNDAGPFFGRNALAALMRDGAPLSGLDIAFHHHRYDWNKSDGLEALLRELTTSDALIAASTEGGLFEYGNDAAVAANLTALRRGHAICVAGSVTSSNESHRRNITQSRLKLIPRGVEGFAPLAERSGFRIARAETAQLSDQVLLVPQAS